MSKNVVKGLAFNQGAEFMQLLQKAGLGSREAQDVIEGSRLHLADQIIHCIRRGGLRAPLTPDEKRAADILGRQRVVGCYEASEQLNLPWPEWEAAPRFFTEETLTKAAKENLKHTAKWWLVYAFGFTAKELGSRGVFTPYGHDSYKLPPQTEAGYHLINFSPHFLDEIWEECNEQLKNRNYTEYTRVADTVLLEALITIEKATSETPFKGFLHWGTTKVPYTDPGIWTAGQPENQLEFQAVSPRKHLKNLGVVVEQPTNCDGTQVEKTIITIKPGPRADSWVAAVHHPWDQSSDITDTPESALGDMLLRLKKMGYPYRKRDYRVDYK